MACTSHNFLIWVLWLTSGGVIEGREAFIVDYVHVSPSLDQAQDNVVQRQEVAEYKKKRAHDVIATSESAALASSTLPRFTLNRRDSYMNCVWIFRTDIKHLFSHAAVSIIP